MKPKKYPIDPLSTDALALIEQIRKAGDAGMKLDTKEHADSLSQLATNGLVRVGAGRAFALPVEP